MNKRDKYHICVVGLGEVGLPTLLYCKDRELDAVGFDILQSAIVIAQNKGIPATMNWHEVGPRNVYMICVPTFGDTKRINAGHVYSACKDIAGHIRKQGIYLEYLVVIESTVPPGFTRKVYDEIFSEFHNVNVAHVPQRYWEGDPKNRGVRRLRLIGGVNMESMSMATDFYCRFLDMPIYPCPLEVAEMAKVSENAYRYNTIAVAQELRMLCDAIGLDFNRVREAIMTASEMHYVPEARDGIGGHCIPMAAEWIRILQNQYLDLGPNQFPTIFHAAQHADRIYREWLSEKDDGADKVKDQP